MHRDVVVAILATLCLTATLFTVLPTWSNPGVGEYDSWADINEDGVINMYDIAYAAQRFGTSGDPTKNVNVTNSPEPPYAQGSMVVNVTWHQGGFGSNFGERLHCGGYSKLVLFIVPVDMSITDVPPWESNVGLVVSVNHGVWYESVGGFPDVHELPLGGSFEETNIIIGSYHDTYFGFYEGGEAHLIDVKGPYLMPWIQIAWNGTAPAAEGWITVRLAWYLRND